MPCLKDNPIFIIYIHIFINANENYDANDEDRAALLKAYKEIRNAINKMMNKRQK